MVKNPHLTLLTRCLTGWGERVGLTADFTTSKYPLFQNWNFSGELWKFFEKCGQKSASNPTHQMYHWLGVERVGLTADFTTSKYPLFQNWNFSGELWKIFRHQIWSHYSLPPIQDWNSHGKLWCCRDFAFTGRFPSNLFWFKLQTTSSKGKGLLYFFRWYFSEMGGLF